MKAKIRPHNVSGAMKDEWDAAKRAYILAAEDEYAKYLQWKLTRRSICAIALVLNDQHGFGSRRIKKAVEGYVEIIAGVGNEVYDPREVEPDGVDKAVDAMMKELIDRNIEIVFRGDKYYDSLDTICERLGIEKKKKLSGVGAPESN